ncbi:3-hydroxyacyl-CoA dehydrogenase NAD-binding domain-containing protein [Bosea sp. (in: a-proteobacteria)]|uniref:3-hydroxyacyl-CoA dehydrogenase NAD-binding domain-containing protein n=1 Tax=Bosea sp. (in: a-proteobacteria) TaxID=1871050 RepID=UPI0027354DF4|nr:3-hydroxyacyl-CoA dehydrogenase NAD-binding domain-containing protein [Bosea sp. (in: a-proteobacteria)]MDP3408445.1 3-hydroxyacyl-CoA dehydrogenase NAD-binding domain-containing protein [Bosea sp. (in: a-proteobacteria)]
MMETVRLARHGEIAIATIDNPPVNALGQALRADLARVIAEAGADPDVTAIVIAASGRAFIAGADISEFGKPPVAPFLPDVLDAIETCRKPVVAAIQGVALGGGLEVALACHGRVASVSASFGLPEIKLGLIPGAGGTQRLPRLIGAAQAFPLMLAGEPIAASRALSLRLVDEVVDGDVVAAAVALARDLAARGAPERVCDRTGRLTAADREAFEAQALAATKSSGEMPNAMALIEAVRGVFTLPFAEGLAVERALFLKLVADPRSAALRHVFFAEREIARVPGIGAEVKPRAIAKAAVIGAGTMGGGIAMCFANAGIPVTLIEQEQAQIDNGMNRVAAIYAMSVTRGSLTPEKREERLALITPAVGLAAAADADIVIEAAFEEMGVKQQIFGALDGIAKPGAILASNTSYLDIPTVAAATKRPQDVLGMHFFSPANVMKLLEVVRPEGVADDAVVTAMALGRRIGKVPVVVGNGFGFVGNRMLEARTRATERLLIAGALPHEVDAALTGFGFKMGPCAMADLAGNDIGWRSRKARGKTAAVADAICEAGWFGQKTGRGYFLYPEGARSGQRDPEVEALIARISEEQGVTRRSLTADEILSRLLDPMVNEGARILEEGIAARPGDIDVIWLNGYNWPAWRGGPMHWADTVGLGTLVARLDAQAAETGDATLQPAPLLRRLADEGKGFADLKTRSA